VDVLSVKEHSRQIMLKYLPKECDILCTRKWLSCNNRLMCTFLYLIFTVS
jgi:hypothetical protein